MVKASCVQGTWEVQVVRHGRFVYKFVELEDGTLRGNGSTAAQSSWSTELRGNVEGAVIKWTEYRNGIVTGEFTATIDASTLSLTGSGTHHSSGTSLRFEGKKLASFEDPRPPRRSKVSVLTVHSSRLDSGDWTIACTTVGGETLLADLRMAADYHYEEVRTAVCKRAGMSPTRVALVSPAGDILLQADEEYREGVSVTMEHDDAYATWDGCPGAGHLSFSKGERFIIKRIQGEFFTAYGYCQCSWMPLSSATVQDPLPVLMATESKLRSSESKLQNTYSKRSSHGSVTSAEAMSAEQSKLAQDRLRSQSVTSPTFSTSSGRIR